MFARLFSLLVLLFASWSAYADCFDDAAAFHNVNPTILRAISIVESGNKPYAVNRNSNGSVDYGQMQINSIHLPELARYHMSQEDLFDGCKSIYTGAWILRKGIDKYGNTWAAIGSYHSSTPYYRDQYAAKVKAIAERLLAYGQ
ncbi:lytic transglycosylase domain-containing protein [Paraburkholderia sp. SIMBA_054]